MGGLRSRILRTLQTLPNAAAQSNILLALPPGAASSPPPATPCSLRQEPAPQEEAPGDEAGAAPELLGAGADGDDKENVSPGVTPRKAKKMKLSSDHHDKSAAGHGEPASASCFRRPDLASATLFDPDLLAAFRCAVDAYAQAFQVSKRRDDVDEDDDGDGVPGGSEGGGGGACVADPLEAFERRCPPGGERAVVLYTTSLRGVRKTFDDCARVRRLLENLRVVFLERDVSMHAPYREELRSLLLRDEEGGGGDPASRAFPLPPRLFVHGRYLGGADEVEALNERSQLRPLLRRVPRRSAGEDSCAVCGGAWFVVCGGCSGSHWLHDAGGATVTAAARVPCSACNENGLVPCPLCS